MASQYETPPIFQEADKCALCSCEFTLLRRRHHCRADGRSVCGDCSSASLPLPQFGFFAPVRVCDECNRAMTGVLDTPRHEPDESVPYVKRDELPKTQRAVVYDEYGSLDEAAPNHWPNVVKVREDVPVPVLGRGQVLCQVAAAAINPVDYKLMIGNLSLAVTGPPGAVPGLDFSGVVVAVGPGCKRLREGDRVWGITRPGKLGTFCEYIAVDEEIVTLKPEGMSFVEACSLPLAATTSLQSLQLGKLREGGSALILGATGGCGAAAIQIARCLGAAEVVGVCSTRNVEFAESLGATRVVDYKQENWWEVLEPKSFDVVYDCLGGFDQWEYSRSRILKSDGVFVTICGDQQTKLNVSRIVKTAAYNVNRKFWSLFGEPSYIQHLRVYNAVDLDTLRQMCEQGGVRAEVDQVFRLDQEGAEGIFAAIITKHTRGKNVLQVTDWAVNA